MGTDLCVLMITSEYPTLEHPYSGIFVARRAETLRRAGIQVEVFAFRGAKNPMNYLRAWWQVRARLSQNRYDLIHAQFGQSGLLALPKQLRLVVTFRGSDLRGIVGRNGRYTVIGYLLQLVGQFVARAADEVIVVSEALACCLPPRSYHVIPGGLDLDLFSSISKEEARRQLGLPLDRQLVLFAADPENPVKRYALAQETLAQLNEACGAELIVTRDVPYSRMPLYMSACDVLLLTSLHEGSPGVVKEALACNLPVVSVDVGDVRQRIGSVEGCVVCADDQPETIAVALQQVLKRRERVNGRAAVQDLDERLLTQKVIAVYERALAR